ncbi:MAG: aldo/keto reductase [Chloroflexi bacterium]|nr:aldo/keto reductase [Chloroflexota bacterium]
MQKRKLGSSDLYISRIGLGTWAIGGGGWRGGWGPQDDSVSIATIQRALDLGINWIDTAPYYGLGHAEEIVGQAITGRREEVIIATKCGLVWNEGSTDVYRRLKAESVRREVEASLRRLSVEAIDLYQIHWPAESDEETEEAWGVIADLMREGKVRYGGVSNFSVAQHQRMQAIHPIASSQPSYNMVMREVEAELLPSCAANNIGVIVARPMMGGLLTGKFSKERAEHLPDDDWRRGREWFVEPQLSANLALVEGLRPIAARVGKTVAQLAIAWVLRHPEVTAAIVGARSPAQLEEDAAAWDWVLSAEDTAEIETLLAKREQMLRENVSQQPQ